jgi:diadenosine tetraphosphate (Ap4A) HIT family hydrolase
MSDAPEWFAEKFGLARLTVKRYAFWTWSVRPVQCTLGASVLSLNRPCAAWGETTAEENAELATVIADIERRLKSCFAYDKINYLMLMMVDPHAHFHVVPRYAAPGERYGLQWIDNGWPKPPDLSSGVADAAVLEQIRQDILSREEE